MPSYAETHTENFEDIVHLVALPGRRVLFSLPLIFLGSGRREWGTRPLALLFTKMGITDGRFGVRAMRLAYAAWTPAPMTMTSSFLVSPQENLKEGTSQTIVMPLIT